MSSLTIWMETVGSPRVVRTAEKKKGPARRNGMISARGSLKFSSFLHNSANKNSEKRLESRAMETLSSSVGLVYAHPSVVHL